MKKNKIFGLLLIIVCVFTFNINVYADCPLGPEVTKDLYNILQIFKIVAPILVIAFTIFEGVKTVASGDGGADIKKLAQRTLKRLIYAGVLFFLPIIIDLVMQIADVWDANGSCDLYNPAEVSEE